MHLYLEKNCEGFFLVQVHYSVKTGFLAKKRTSLYKNTLDQNPGYFVAHNQNTILSFLAYESRMAPVIQVGTLVADTSSASYVPQSPPWAQPSPPHLWSLMEIKNGVQVAKHDLSCRPGRNIVVLGRDEQADILMQHASISRFHARIAFDKEQGSPWLRDLSSSHGVLVNKRRLPPNSIGRDESMSSVAGSRGVMIFPGDIIQLGASTRYFCVLGPSEFERPMTTKRKLPQPRLEVHSFESFSDSGNFDSKVGVELSDDEGEINGDHQLSDETVPESFRPEWERIKVLRQKLNNIQNESERIHMKGDAGSETLSSGQIKQLERNEERVSTLHDQIRTKESELVLKVFPNVNEILKRKRGILNDNIEEEDDDYLDRTNDDNRGFTLNQDGESEQSLLVKWEVLQTQHTDISQKLKSLSQKVLRLTQSLEDLDEDEDRFFVRNELDVLHDTRAKLETEEKRLIQNLTEIDALVRVVNPKLRKVGVGSSVPSEGKSGLTIKDKGPTRVDGKISEVRLIDKLAHLEQRLGSSPEIAEETSHQPVLLPTPKWQHGNTSSTPKVGTLAYLSSSSVYPEKSGRSQMRSDRTLRTTDVAEVALNNEQQQDVWQIPKHQDGSGKTKLNAKFAGRY